MKYLKIRKESGITLIALVVTIVVLLILASVSITVVFGDNGILELAKEAGEKTNEAVKSDLEDMKNLENTIGDIVNNGWSISKVTATMSADGKMVPVPKGFVGSNANGENTVSGGFVIYEGTSPVTNENVEQAKTTRNQFVWIPVDGENLKYEQDKTSWGGTEYYTDHDIWKDEEDIDFRKESVKTYGGFYVGRYEAGFPGSDKYEDGQSYEASEETRNKTDVGMPVVRKGFQAWNFINQINAKNLSQQMYNNECVKSSLMDSYAWDTMTKWLENNGIEVNDCASWGSVVTTSEQFEINGLYALHKHIYGTEWQKDDMAISYKKGNHTVKWTSWIDKEEYVELSTGITDRNCKKNIYDLAGNLAEWTSEIGNVRKLDWNYDTASVVRGSAFVDSAKVGSRYSLWDITKSSVQTGFRTVLYIMNK